MITNNEVDKFLKVWSEALDKFEKELHNYEVATHAAYPNGDVPVEHLRRHVDRLQVLMINVKDASRRYYDAERLQEEPDMQFKDMKIRHLRRAIENV